jgi:uncharacterized protein YyaL (SSP411 family)
MRTGPSMTRGPFDLGVMVTWVMRANIAARFGRRRCISRVRDVVVVLCAALTGGACLVERGPFTNRMAHSGTSYLTRAARQPVSWQPWGRHAFALAARLDRPVLLYIGNDTCHWCAETDRAIYTDPEIGALINALFVPIRVDRDERPDVAQRYQSAVERLAGLRGWPLTVFLTADGSPFFGGTYFPADDPITGRGLKQLLPEIAKSYRDRRSFIVQQAALVRQLVLTSNAEARGVLRASLVRQGIAAVAHDLNDAVEAGMAAGSVMHVEAVSLLLTEYARERDSTALAVARHALDRMLDTARVAAGDDPPRLVRAALIGGLAKGWIVTGEQRYRDAGRSLLRALARQLPNIASLSGEAVFADQQAYVIENLMLAAATLGEPEVEARARAALDVLLQRVYARGWGVRHTVTGSGARDTAPQGLLRDQVQVASACLAAHQLSGDKRYLGIALDLATILERRYADSLGGYYDAAEPAAPPELGDRTKHVFDDGLPGANAAAARLLAHLSVVTADPSYRRRAQATLEAFAGKVPNAGVRATTFLAAARELLSL